MTTTPLYLNIDNGIFEGTIKSNNKIITSPQTLFSSYPLDSNWTQHGSGWTTDNNKVTFNNTTSSNTYLDEIYTIDQTVIKKIIFRITASGLNIIPFTGDDFSIKLTLTDAGGLSGNILATETLAFPSGTWSEQQFTISLTPSAPAKYIYVYIFTRNSIGQLTFWDAECFQEGDTARTNGKWTSNIQDLAKVTQLPIASGHIPLKNIYFYYGYLEDVDGMNNVEYSIDRLNKADIIITHEPSLLNTRQLVVVNSLIANSKEVYGYAIVGSTDVLEVPGFVIAAKAIMDRCFTSGYDGVFFDCFGYDWKVTRAQQNELIDYAHAKTPALKVFANAWIPADCLDDVVNATYNPTGVVTKLTTNDWVLLESFYCNASGYKTFPDAFNKYTTTVSLATPLGVKVCGLSYALPTTLLTDFRDWVNTYVLASGFGMQGFQYSTDIGSEDLNWPLEIFSPPNIGTTLISSFEQVQVDTYEAKTNEGIILFTSTDSPLKREYKSFILPSSFNVVTYLPQINATRVSIINYSSADKITWTELSSLSGITNRYFKTEISVRN